ncbi:MAG: class I SAM-dependent methyltransferase [Acidobacteria bacterium]|nr:class I SAM-dependent methyltransferase [Acidobacteriota bacterium]
MNTGNKIQYSWPEGKIEITSAANRRFCVTLAPHDPNRFLPRRSCETTFPLELIQFLIEKMDGSWLCDSIARHEDPAYVTAIIRRQLFSYLPVSAYRGKRLLDFGCGTGASTFAIAQSLPETEVVGIELEGALIEVARRIADFRGLANAQFLQSSDAENLPPNVGMFDFVMLCAVYEHLLPNERKNLMPKLWSVLKPGGIIFINQTPHRYFPYEHHSTGLWLINYLPDRIAYFFARKVARRKLLQPSDYWEDLLRGGIRGGTEKSIIHDLCRGDSKAARILRPHENGLRDRADYWLSCTDPDHYRRTKRLLAALFRLSDRLFGTVPSMNVDVVLRKEYSDSKISVPQASKRGMFFRPKPEEATMSQQQGNHP